MGSEISHRSFLLVNVTDSSFKGRRATGTWLTLAFFFLARKVQEGLSHAYHNTQ